MKQGITVFLILFSFYNGWTQILEGITHREINVHYNDSSIKANVLIEQKNIPINNKVDYYWYYNNEIKMNQGGYKGKLLDGNYQITKQKEICVSKGILKEETKLENGRNGMKKENYFLLLNGIKEIKMAIMKNMKKGY